MKSNLIRLSQRSNLNNQYTWTKIKKYYILEEISNFRKCRILERRVRSSRRDILRNTNRQLAIMTARRIDSATDAMKNVGKRCNNVSLDRRRSGVLDGRWLDIIFDRLLPGLRKSCLLAAIKATLRKVGSPREGKATSLSIFTFLRELEGESNVKLTNDAWFPRTYFSINTYLKKVN